MASQFDEFSRECCFRKSFSTNKNEFSATTMSFWLNYMHTLIHHPRVFVMLHARLKA
jgi:hypothetical protein